ncbi:hypothetical protein O0235_01545 [Tepidiforma flava]|uniref:Uncharacterized protein n=1 Tax=Tepidiforma flava TaxID=3004094 RepID=A0ABY7M818_9CHLR|nr:hypothetical protein [Tepidiforma flava]WBL36297.1 hypothetical protein O0235_01545 [Tepidiforma flava]
MAAADARAQDEPAIPEAAITGAGDHRGAGGGGDGGGGAGVVAVAVGEEDAFERAAERLERGKDSRGAIGEAGIDEGKAA